MTQLDDANKLLHQVNDLVTGKDCSKKSFRQLKVGLDLGTSSIVLVVVNEDNQPIFAQSEEAKVVRDGLVVDYLGAVRISNRLKEAAEEAVGVPLTAAAGAIPPGTIGNNKQVIQNIIEAIGLTCLAIIDEPTAAAKVLSLVDGAVVDIGGGTTGISIFEDKEVVFSGDEPTGGTQMTLVLSGYYQVPTEEGELLKRDRTKEREHFPILRPVVEKMATISQQFILQYGKKVSQLYLVGGATNFNEFEGVFEKQLNIPVLKPDFPQFVTPLGIAMSISGGE